MSKAENYHIKKMLMIRVPSLEINHPAEQHCGLRTYTNLTRPSTLNQSILSAWVKF